MLKTEQKSPPPTPPTTTTTCSLTTSTLLHKLYQKVRTLAKDCNLQPPQSLRKDPQPPQLLLAVCLNTLQELRRHIISNRNLSDDYRKLEELIQRTEAEHRRGVGVQHQLKLYAESLQQRWAEEREELERELDEQTGKVGQLGAEVDRLREEVNRLKFDKANKHRQQPPSHRDTQHHQHRPDTFRQMNCSLPLSRPQQTSAKKFDRTKSRSKSPYSIRPATLKSSINQSSQRFSYAKAQEVRSGDNVSYLINSLKKKKKRNLNASHTLSTRAYFIGNAMMEKEKEKEGVEVRPFEKGRGAVGDNTKHVRIRTEVEMESHPIKQEIEVNRSHRSLHEQQKSFPIQQQKSLPT